MCFFTGDPGEVGPSGPKGETGLKGESGTSCFIMSCLFLKEQFLAGGLSNSDGVGLLLEEAGQTLCWCTAALLCLKSLIAQVNSSSLICGTDWLIP